MKITKAELLEKLKDVDDDGELGIYAEKHLANDDFMEIPIFKIWSRFSLRLIPMVIRLDRLTW